MQSLSLQQLLEAGSHFGHQTKRWHPKMKRFIYTQKNGIHIINLELTIKMADEAAKFIKEIIAKGGMILFLGTKRQAREIIKEEAQKCGSMYVNDRWIGGLLTNFDSVKKTIEKYNSLLEQSKSEEFHKLTKKEQSVFQKKFARLDKIVGGIKELRKPPDAIFILDTKREKIAVIEANKVGIPVIAICDTNSNPDLIDYPIPGNDDAVKSIKLFVSFISNSILEAQGKPKVEVGPEIEKKAPIEPKAEKKSQVEEDKEIEGLNLSSRTLNALKRSKIKTVSELKGLEDEEILEIKGLGKTALEEIKKAIK